MINYDLLWHKLIDLKIKKSELKDICGISSSTLAKLSKNEVVSLEILEKICCNLNCDIGDIVSFRDGSEYVKKTL